MSASPAPKAIIVGSGPAGLTAAIYLSRANVPNLLFEGQQPGGQLTITTEVENFPGFPDGITGPELMIRLKAQAERFGTVVKGETVEAVDLSAGPYKVRTNAGSYEAPVVIIASGSTARWLHLPDEEKFHGKGLSACATCDGFFFRGQEIAVVGGGDTAFEEATYLTRFATKVHLLHRRDTFRASKIMVDRALEHPKIDVHPNVAVEEVLGEAKVEGVALRDTVTGKTETLPVEGLFIAIGYQPNTAAFRDWLDVDEKGYLVVHDETGSKIDGVFIAGDVHDHRYRQAVTAAADGCKAAIDAERWLEAQELGA